METSVKMKLGDLGVLESLFGNSSRMKIIGHFLEFPTNEFTVNELVKEIGMSKTTVPKEIEVLVGSGMIEKSKKNGKSQPYKINLKNPVIQLIQSAVYITSDNIAEQQTGKRKVMSIARSYKRGSKASLIVRRDALKRELEHTNHQLKAIPAQ